MRQIIPFLPTHQVPFQFTATVGGETLFITVPYNLYANRYYLRVRDGNNATVVYTPLIGSPDGKDINLLLPYAPGKLVYRVNANHFEAT